MSSITNIADHAFEECPTITGPVRHGYRRRSKQVLMGAQRKSNARFECPDCQAAAQHCLLNVNGGYGPSVTNPTLGPRTKSGKKLV